MFPYFEILGRVVGSYAVCSVAGMLICGWVAVWLGRRYGIAMEEILLCMVAIVLGLLIGGHVVYGITHLPELVELLGHISQYSVGDFFVQLGQIFGGMVFYGGFIGAAVALCIYLRFHKSVERKHVLDIFAVGLPLFHTFGRLGCFLGGCCYGKESSWGVLITDNPLQPELNGVVRIPVQLIESFCNLCIFLVLLFLIRKGRLEGKLLFLYMILYPVVRFILEFFRGDEIRGFLWGISTSQWISILLLIVAVYKLFLQRHGIHGSDSNSGKERI